MVAPQPVPYASTNVARPYRRERCPGDLIRRIGFLKTAVVVSADATNELAIITAARRDAKTANAVANFCKPFDFDDPEKELTGVAFLIVCDMLLTGFDAPVEQVMYIDKRLREHNLLQAIARVNRVAKGKRAGSSWITSVWRITWPKRCLSTVARRRRIFSAG